MEKKSSNADFLVIHQTEKNKVTDKFFKNKTDWKMEHVYAIKWQLCCKPFEESGILAQ